MRINYAAIAASTLFMSVAAAAHAQTEIQWWHAMTGANNDRVNQLAEQFNASQKEYKVVPSFKGAYADTLNAGIAAYRSGNAPHIMQVFEVGTATMMGAKGAVKPVYELMAEAGEKFDTDSYLPAISGYYTTTDGKMLSLPFNSSTPITYYNKDAFKKAGLNPDKAPATWPEVFEDAKKLRAAGYSCGFTLGWVSWTNIENFGALHNFPVGTKANGFGGLDTEFVFEKSALLKKHFATLVELSKDKTFDYGGRTSEPEAKFSSGECPMIQTSSGFIGTLLKAAKFEFGTGMLPYYPDVQGAPQNSIIGGASLWVMGGKKPDEYKGVAKFFSFLSQTDVQVENHTVTGYLPVTKAAYEATKKSGFYEKNPGRETPILSLNNKAPTENSKGVRFGNMAQIRDVFLEEIEAALAGKQTADQAIDKAAARGNAILRTFQKQAS